jgi:K+-transporting ATPase ATPase C chain
MEDTMYSQLRPAVVALILLSILTGVVYPLLVTGIARLAFGAQADGSIITVQGRLVGSKLIGQSFDDPRYFWARPSATVPSYDASAGSGSNLAPTNPALIKAVQDRIDRLRAVDPADQRPIPIDLVTASGSGLDPHITPAAAEYQVARVSRARNLDEATVRRLAAAHTQQRQFGLLGEPRVNVLQLNLALDRFIAAGAAGYNGRTQ